MDIKGLIFWLIYWIVLFIFAVGLGGHMATGKFLWFLPKNLKKAHDKEKGFPEVATSLDLSMITTGSITAERMITDTPNSLRGVCGLGGPREAASDCIRSSWHEGDHEDRAGGTWPVGEMPRFSIKHTPDIKLMHQCAYRREEHEVTSGDDTTWPYTVWTCTVHGMYSKWPVTGELSSYPCLALDPY